MVHNRLGVHNSVNVIVCLSVNLLYCLVLVTAALWLVDFVYTQRERLLRLQTPSPLREKSSTDFSEINTLRPFAGRP